MGTELQDRVGFFIGESRFLTFQIFFRGLFCLFILSLHSKPMVLHIISCGFMPCAHPDIGDFSEYHISLNLLSVSLDARFTVEVKSLKVLMHFLFASITHSKVLQSDRHSIKIEIHRLNNDLIQLPNSFFGDTKSFSRLNDVGGHLQSFHEALSTIACENRIIIKKTISIKCWSFVSKSFTDAKNRMSDEISLSATS